uniref:Peptidase_M14 domain-containing protein n=1 Tax=Caenorhabditis japonica TaxID=281687 RepID=A0A8R1HUL0_CAEJA
MKFPALLLFGAGIILIGFASASDYKNYDGFKILEVKYAEPRVRRYVQEIEQHLGFMPDFLGENWKLQQAHYFIEKDSVARVSRQLTANNITHRMRDLNQNIFKVRKRRDLENSQVTIQDVNYRYLNYNEQMQFINTVAQQFPNTVKLQKLGNSYEGRSITAVRIGDDGTNKPIVWIDAGIHAREWISYNVALYLIYTIASEPAYRDLLSSVQLVVVPNTNPDGYEYSRTHDRMWRKTRSRFTNSRCGGADANRNYPFYWGTKGVSHSQCSEIYCGTRAQSEPEVLALTNAIQREETRIKGYIALHSYGQEILYPWGHTMRQYPSDVQDLIQVGQAMAAAVKAINNTEYSVVNSGDGLYPAAGASDDWAKSRGIKFSYTIELSPIDDETGFTLPEDRINQVNREAFQAIQVLMIEVKSRFGIPKVTSSASASANSLILLKRLRTTMSRGLGRG